MTVFINVIGGTLIAFIVWWFWCSRVRVTDSGKKVIQVLIKDGTYSPARIAAQANQPIIIEFLRKDNTPCSQHVVFERIGVHQRIPYDQPYQIQLGLLEPGRYTFACQMNMYRGELIVN